MKNFWERRLDFRNWKKREREGRENAAGELGEGSYFGRRGIWGRGLEEKRADGR